MKTKREAWELYDAAPYVQYAWEIPEQNMGLLLPMCAHCGHAATRETYVGFWSHFYTLHQGLSIRGIGQCPQCHQWNKIVD